MDGQNRQRLSVTPGPNGLPTVAKIRELYVCSTPDSRPYKRGDHPPQLRQEAAHFHATVACLALEYLLKPTNPSSNAGQM